MNFDIDDNKPAYFFEVRANSLGANTLTNRWIYKHGPGLLARAVTFAGGLVTYEITPAYDDASRAPRAAR